MKTYREFEVETTKNDYKFYVGVLAVAASFGMSVLISVIHIALVVSFASANARHMTYLNVLQDVRGSIGVLMMLVFLISFISIIGFVNLSAHFQKMVDDIANGEDIQ